MEWTQLAAVGFNVSPVDQRNRYLTQLLRCIKYQTYIREGQKAFWEKLVQPSLFTTSWSLCALHYTWPTQYFHTELFGKKTSFKNSRRKNCQKHQGIKKSVTDNFFFKNFIYTQTLQNYKLWAFYFVVVVVIHYYLFI